MSKSFFVKNFLDKTVHEKKFITFHSLYRNQIPRLGIVVFEKKYIKICKIQNQKIEFSNEQNFFLNFFKQNYS